MTENSFVKENLLRIQERINDACIAANRAPDTVELMAVTKTVAPQYINEAIEAGITAIGENRVQEYLGKCDALRLQNVRTNLIGHLQTNKVRSIVGKIDRIDSVDSEHVATAINTASAAVGKSTDILVQVNIGREPQKSGVLPEDLPALLEKIAVLPHISVKGLMTIPPIFETEYEKRKIFSQFYQLFVDIRAKKLDNIDMQVLSMGMSGDFYEAILEGATTVRVGTAIFGHRNY